MKVVVFQYPACSTCKKALRWLDAEGIAYQSKHIVETPPSRSVLKRLHKQSGLPIRKFFNTSGKAYREGGYSAALKTMSDDEALDALAGNGMLIKRPLVSAGETTLVGFKEEAWKASLT